MIYAYKLQSVCGQIQLQLILNILPNLFAMLPHAKMRNIATANIVYKLTADISAWELINSSCKAVTFAHNTCNISRSIVTHYTYLFEQHQSPS
jgi:hypothetical protein